MALTAEQLALITAFRKEAEDLGQANVEKIYQRKQGELAIVVGDNQIALPGDPYASADGYEIVFFEAIDEDLIDIKEAISIETQTTGGFVINTPRAGNLRWITFLKVPNFSYWTN